MFSYGRERDRAHASERLRIANAAKLPSFGGIGSGDGLCGHTIKKNRRIKPREAVRRAFYRIGVATNFVRRAAVKRRNAVGYSAAFRLSVNLCGFFP